MLSVASASAFAHSLLSPAKANASANDGSELELCDLFNGRDVGADLDADAEPGNAAAETVAA